MSVFNEKIQNYILFLFYSLQQENVTELIYNKHLHLETKSKVTRISHG